MKELHEFVAAWSQVGSCRCGRCMDAPEVAVVPPGHTVNMIFFDVALIDKPSKEKFIELTKANKTGSFNSVDMFDGHEHNYMELGGWIGDQGAALQYMGMGVLLDVFDLMSPITMLGLDKDNPLVKQGAERGFLSIKAKKQEELATA